MRIVCTAQECPRLYSAVVPLLIALIIHFGPTTRAFGQGSAALGLSRDIWFSIRSDGQPGSGTMNDPFNGAAGQIDAKLREFQLSNQTNLHFHLLPGTYETRGLNVWSPLTGWKVKGAGVDLTIFKLVGASNDVGAVIGIEHWNPQDNVEVSDLTVDCNNTTTNPNFANAVTLAGTRHTIRRVKAINAGGGYKGFENGVLYIVSVLTPSEGNLIEDCEVSDFKGSYGIGILMSGGSTQAISGIIRGNKVYDFRSTRPYIALNAYAGGALKNVIFENNFAYRCHFAVNFDTYRSANITFRGNQFVGCRARGLALLGRQMDNIVVENNFIEIDATARDYSIVCWDLEGTAKLQNYSIRNNTLRALNGRSGLAGGLYVYLVNGESFSISGNRIDSGLRSVINAPGASCFDNTDLLGGPINLYPGYEGNQVSLPKGERGTLLLNKGNAYIMVETSANSASNGVKLASAYGRAKAMRPHDQPLSAENRATVFLFPGIYSLADSALVLDTPFVDLVGMGDASATRLESSGNVLVQTASNVQLQNLTLYCSSTAPLNFSASDKAAYFPGDNLSPTIIKNCVFGGNNNGLSMRLGVNYAGYYENCQAGPLSFGAGGFRGTAKNCTAGHNSFGGSGALIGCEIAGAINPSVPTTGKLTDCRIGPAPANTSAIVLGNDASLYNCTILATPSGTGVSIDAVSSVQARIAHCRLNRGIRNVVNLISQAANVEDPDLD